MLFLTMLTAVAMSHLISPGDLAAPDPIGLIYPLYSHLAERLRAEDIPGWNPHQFSGAPFAGDLHSGWMYWPAMLMFTLLPLPLAADSYLVFHMLLAGLSAYALARVLGLSIAGALVTSILYEYSAYSYVNAVCCLPSAMVYAWFPITILATEMAIRSRDRLSRWIWWGCAGFALAQILAAWLGQGAYYVLLVLLGYVAYRTLLAPSGTGSGARSRLATCAMHGVAIPTAALLLAAATVLPAMEYVRLSNLAAGYRAIAGEAVIGGLAFTDWPALFRNGNKYVGSAALMLALAAPFLARRRYTTPYWFVTSIAVLVLAAQETTLLHRALYLLPGMSGLHTHYPERILHVFYLGPALLAGITISSLRDQIPRAFYLGAGLASVAWLLLAGLSIPQKTALLAILGAAVLAGRSPRPDQRWAAVALLLLVLFADVHVMRRSHVVNPAGYFTKVELDSYYRSPGVVDFLLAKQADGPVRHVGYFPQPMPYTDPLAPSLLVDNRAARVGLYDVQGYNPVHLARYDEYIQALNGRPQSHYRRAFVYERGLDSPLLDALNVRYVILPVPDAGGSGVGPRRPEGSHPVVYRDSVVEVIERPEVLPRAWIVHTATVLERDQALQLLARREVDLRSTVLLENAPPPLAQPTDVTADRAVITEYAPDRLRVRTTTAAAGMLVIGDPYHPAWRAYVDGKHVPLYVANHALRGVPVPAGEHKVELRYESAWLRLGAATSAASYLVLTLALAAGASRRWREWRGRAS